MASLDWRLVPGAGASPLFPPHCQNEGEAKRALLLVIRRDPRQWGHQRSRWTLQMLMSNCGWLQVTHESSLWRLLRRLGIHYKRSRDYVHSPDRHYAEKLRLIQLAQMRAYDDPQRFVLVYVDEFSYYRQPTLAAAYETAGRCQPLARRSHQRNTQHRVMAALNAWSGQVTYRQRSRITRFVVADFWGQLRADYAQAERIYAVVDNWPVHFHADALARLQPQQLPWPPYVPPHWPLIPSATVPQDKLPIQLLCLPTYASWLNPIEKLWRWLKQDVLHLHPYSDDWPLLKQQVACFLEQFSSGSQELLRYTGLLGN